MDELKVGDTIKFISTQDPYLILTPGTVGEVIAIESFCKEIIIKVKWNNGHTIALLPEQGDVFTIEDSFYSMFSKHRVEKKSVPCADTIDCND